MLSKRHTEGTMLLKARKRGDYQRHPKTSRLDTIGSKDAVKSTKLDRIYLNELSKIL